MARKLPEINASSMADIAFLLLVFFLVTTEINIDEGIGVILPPWSEEPPPPVELNDRNTLTVLINGRDQLLVEEELFDISNLREYAKRFITNNGRDPGMSESPRKAVISFKGDVGTSYDAYIQVYNELIGAFNDLRNQRTNQLTRGRVKEYSALDRGTRDSLIYKQVKFEYPKRLSEAEPTNITQQ